MLLKRAFQGQEAPIVIYSVVIYSVTTSSYLDAPRGMEFLYSANRLNVATSRARAICVLVASSAIFEAECRTPRACSAQAESMGFDGIHGAFWIGDSIGIDSPLGEGNDACGLLC